MGEQKHKMEAIGLTYDCDNCGTELIFKYSSNALLSDPLQYVHRCKTCGREHLLNKSYPSVEYKRVD